MIALCLLGAALAVVVSGFFSGSETGFYCLNRLRLRLDAERGEPRAARLARFVAHEHDALATVLVGTNLANYLVTAFATVLLARAWNIVGGAAEIYATVLVTPVLFVFGEVVPKVLYQRHADRLMRLGAVPITVAWFVLRLPAVALRWISRRLLTLVDPAGIAATADPRRHVALLLQDALAADDAVADHFEYIDRVLGLSSVPIHRVMVPRNDVVIIRRDADRRQCLALVRRHPHSRLPVIAADPRRVVGYVQIHTLLADEHWTHVGEHLQPIETLGAHESVAAAIVRLQAARQSMAVVVDRNGLLLGLVTLKDLLEELTGELHAW